MRYDWIEGYLLQKPGVTQDLQKDWNWRRYQVGGKMFAAVCLDESDKPYYITMKLDPMEGDLLRRQYEDIIPGYYMNKLHWNSVRVEGAVPDDVVKTMLDHAYELVSPSWRKKYGRSCWANSRVRLGLKKGYTPWSMSLSGKRFC